MSLENSSPASIDAQLKSIQQLIQTAKFNDAINYSSELLKATSDAQSKVKLWY